MTEARWNRFCVVGLGNHARTKLLPAILANGQQIAGDVSRNPDPDGGVRRFKTVSQAVAELPADTAFIVASPPTLHFAQTITALEAGRDVIVEKPAFVTELEALAAVRAAKASGALLVEGFMNRHTVTHRLFLDQWAVERPKAAHMVFTIPSVPEGSFRSSNETGASNLYDIASYALSALIDAGVDIADVQLDHVDFAGEPARERLHMSGLAGDVRFSSVTGVAADYENVMRLERADGSSISFTPFIYGRPGPRRMLEDRGGEVVETGIEDVNAFEAMLAQPLSHWRDTAVERGQRMVDLTRHLERLGRTLTAFRAAAS